MKKLTLLTALALTSLSAVACTVTVGEKFDDDDIVDDADDDDFVDDADFVDDSDEDASDVETTSDDSQASESEDTDEDTDAATSEGTSQGETTASTAEDAGNGEATSTEAPTTSGDSTSSGDPVNPQSDQCEPPGEPYSCAECMHFHCSVEWSACCGDPDCIATWNQITACVANPMSDEPIEDVDRCASDASPTGDQLDLSENVQFLMSCVGEEFMGEDDLYGHQPGEGTCTLYCYGVEAIFPPQE